MCVFYTRYHIHDVIVMGLCLPKNFGILQLPHTHTSCRRKDYHAKFNSFKENAVADNHGQTNTVREFKFIIYTVFQKKTQTLKIDPYNSEQCRFKVGAFFETPY